MSVTCPNKKLKKWLDLEVIHGEDSALFLWTEFDGKVPKEFYSSEVNVQIPADHEPTYRFTYQNKKVDIIESHFKPRYSPKKAESKRMIIRDPNIDKARYESFLPKGSIKRAVAERFFRYFKYDSDGNTSPVVYPYYYSDTFAESKKFIDVVNGLFKGRVVGVDGDKIVFDPNIEDAIYVGGDKVYNEPVEEEVVEEKVVPIVDEAGIAALDTVIGRIKEKLAVLTQRASKSGGSAQLRANISAFKSQISKLENEKSLMTTRNILGKMAAQDAVVIENNLNNIRDNINVATELTKEQIEALMDTLILNRYNIQGWIDIQNFAEDSDDVSINELEKVASKYSRLNKEWNELSKELFTEYANMHSSRDDFSKDDLFNAVNDASLYRAGVLSLSESDINLFKVVDDITRRTTSTINEESFKKKSEVRVHEENLEKAGFSKNEVNEKFKQLDSKGNWTGNVVGDVRHSYYTTRAKLLNEAKANNKWAEYKDWIKNNSKSLNVKQLKDITDGKYDSSKNIGYSKDELDIQKELLNEYKDDKSAYKELVEMKYGDSKFAKEEMDMWELDNSPFLAIQGEKNNGRHYLIKEKPDVKIWGDKRFDEIKNNKSLYEFYQFIRERFAENNKQLGFFNQFEEFYLPEKRINFGQEWMQAPLNKKVGLLGYGIKKAISEDMSEDFETTYVNGKPIRKIPIGMMWNKIPPKLKESDIFGVLNSHTEMSLAHKYKSEIEPIIKSASELLDGMKQLNSGDKEVENQLATAKKQLQFHSEQFLYGVKKNKGEGKLMEIKTKEEIVEDGEVVEKEVIRTVTVNKIGDSLITYTYMKAIGLNPLVSGVNLAFGINANLIYASANEEVDIKDMNKALIQMATVTAKSFGGKNNSELVNKTFAFMERLHVLGIIHDSEYGSKKSLTEKMGILQEKTEYYNQGALMLATLYKHKLLDKNGNEVNLFDAYNVVNDDLVWNEELMGKQSETPNTRVISEDKKGVNLFSLERHIDKINKSVHGDYKSAMMAKKSIGLRTVLLFKTWIFQAVEHRFGRVRNDKDLLNKEGFFGKDVKGRYLSLFKSETLEGQTLLVKDTLKMLLKGFVSKKSLNRLSDIDRVNMLRNIREIKHILAFYTAALLLKGLFMDDDDESKAIVNLTINMLTKTQADMSFFLNPSSMSQMMDNIVPVYSTIRDVENTIKSAFGTLTGDIMYANGPFKDSPKLLINTLKLTPGAAVPIKIWNTSSRVFNY